MAVGRWWKGLRTVIAGSLQFGGLVTVSPTATNAPQ